MSGTQHTMEWWCNETERSAVQRNLPHSVIGLHVCGIRDRKLIDRLYSGVVVSWRGKYLWLSSGHVLQHIRDSVEADHAVDVTLRLVDSYQDGPASAIPFFAESHRYLNFEPDTELDFGFVPIDAAFARLLNANDQFEPYMLDKYARPPIRRPDGILVVGYPRFLNVSGDELRTTESVDRDTLRTQVRRRLNAFVAGVPLSRPLTPRELGSAGVEAKTGTIVCRLLPDDVDVPDADGLSGGPVFVWHRGRGGRRYLGLLGIQECWNRKTRCVRIVMLDAALAWMKVAAGDPPEEALA